MKKKIMIGAFGIFVLASCKKDYMCECINYSTSQNGTTSTSTTSFTIRAYKDNALKECAQASSGSVGGNFNQQCSL